MTWTLRREEGLSDPFKTQPNSFKQPTYTVIFRFKPKPNLEIPPPENYAQISVATPTSSPKKPHLLEITEGEGLPGSLESPPRPAGGGETRAVSSRG